MGDSGKEGAESPSVLSATASVTTTSGETSEVSSLPPPLPPREHLIVTAVKFLSNPDVVRSAINKKQSFLRSKGLTEDEIQIACERAGVFTGDSSAGLPNQTVISMGLESSGPTFAKSNYHQLQKPSTFLARVKDILSSVTMLSGLMYGLYLFYKKFIEPLLFRGKKKKTVTEQLTELNRTVTVQMDTLNGGLTKIQEELSRANQTNTTDKELKNIKTDLDSIKGLLLNRKQFTSSSNLPIVPPSIPAWQLRSQQHQQPNSEGEHDKIDDNDTGSGSGSSENDVVLKNSDSSLEIM